MNAKTAKKLRKIAVGMVVAAETQDPTKKIERVSYLIHNKTGVVTVAKNTWKGAYKALKKGLRNASAGSAFHRELTSIQARRAAVAGV